MAKSNNEHAEWMVRIKNALPLQLCEMKVQTLGELRMRDTANCGLGYLL